MPQLDFANPLTTSQVVWMAIIFGGLYYLLSTWALPQVASVLDNRAARIGADLDSARLAKLHADTAVAELQEATRRAASEAQSAIAGAIAQAKAEAAEQARAESERLDAQLHEAEQRIAAARQSAMGALRDVATETANTVVSRLTGHAPDPALVGGAVDRAMTAKA